MPALIERESRFVQYLQKLAESDDRPALAALRRGLSGSTAEMHRYVVPYLPPDAPEYREDHFYLVAALFALHPRWAEEGQPSNFGASFARLAESSGSESIEKRFVALLNAHPDDVPEHLRHAVALLKSKQIPVDWAQLLHDLWYWNHEKRFVQRDWARAFWGRQAEEEQPADEASA